MCARVLLPASDLNDRGLHARVDRLERRMALGVPEADLPAAEAVRPVRETTRPAPEAARPVRETTRPAPEAARPAPEPAPSDDGPPWEVPEPAGEPAPEPARPATKAKRPAPEPARPAPETERPAPAPEPVRPAPVPESTAAVAAPAVASGSLGVADLRRLWPQILDNVKDRRRFTWILLSQNSQVVEVRDDVVTIGLANTGARDSFSKGGSSDVLRDAILDVLGAAVRIETILDATADDPRPATSAGRPAAAPAPEPEPDRDDADVKDDVSGEELLMRHLGAELLDDDH
jgi:DNA polymerase-3 subunit gamma/tau